MVPTITAINAAIIISLKLSQFDDHLAAINAITTSAINVYATLLLDAHSGPIAAVVLENSDVAKAKYVPIADTEYNP